MPVTSTGESTLVISSSSRFNGALKGNNCKITVTEGSVFDAPLTCKVHGEILLDASGPLRRRYVRRQLAPHKGSERLGHAGQCRCRRSPRTRDGIEPLQRQHLGRGQAELKKHRRQRHSGCFRGRPHLCRIHRFIPHRPDRQHPVPSAVIEVASGSRFSAPALPVRNCSVTATSSGHAEVRCTGELLATTSSGRYSLLQWRLPCNDEQSLRPQTGLIHGSGPHQPTENTGYTDDTHPYRSLSAVRHTIITSTDNDRFTARSIHTQHTPGHSRRCRRPCSAYWTARRRYRYVGTPTRHNRPQKVSRWHGAVTDAICPKGRRSRPTRCSTPGPITYRRPLPCSSNTLLRSTTEPEGARILDLCAAPGGKATLYSTLAGGDGIVIANEVIRSRALILADNIRKWGIGNTMVTNNDPAHFAGLGEWFDAVAIDAPCSGEGMFRKSPEARGEWSEANVRLCAARQRRIVSDAWAALRPGGV